MKLNIDYTILPEHMREGAKRYIEQGIIPGRFLELIFLNDFVHAWCQADIVNRQNMEAYAKFLYWEAPNSCWGNEQRMKEWSEARQKEPYTS